MSARPLRILHCFRSPVGGIFRHVRDLVHAQHAAGHLVGILCDSSTGGEYEDRMFDELQPALALGLTRIPMRRAITPGDVATLAKAAGEIRRCEPDILHSHGAKGGAYARVIGTMQRLSGSRVARLYCPHGGSIHFDGQSWKGRAYFLFERLLERMTDRLIFVSEYERDGYLRKVGAPRCPTSLVYNGLSDHEFNPVSHREDAADFLYIGMMRDLKGPDLFLEAMAILNRDSSTPITAHFVGDGPDKLSYVQKIETLGLGKHVSVHDAMPAREAFAMAKCVVVPSRAESMPYLVLEAIAACRPVLATRVGGIPEIFREESDLLIPPADADALAQAMAAFRTNPEKMDVTRARQAALRERFSIETMARTIEQAYRETI